MTEPDCVPHDFGPEFQSETCLKCGLHRDVLHAMGKAQWKRDMHLKNEQMGNPFKRDPK